MKDFFEDISAFKEVQLNFEPEYENLLRFNSFKSLPDFMIVESDERCRDVPGRLTVRLDLKDDAGISTICYLKRHWQVTSGKGKPHFEADSEWENIKRLHDDGVSVPRPMAFGKGSYKGDPVSFVLTKEVPGYQGDHFIERHFDLTDLKRKHMLLAQLGEFSGKFHRLGYNHRDFYLCHTFIHDKGSEFELNLIDLQRVQKRTSFRGRWIIKDLSQMNYSAFSKITCHDRLRFFKKYVGRDTLTSADKRLISAVLKKTEQLRKKEEAARRKGKPL